MSAPARSPWWTLVVRGALAVVLGVLIALLPGAGALTVSLLIATFAVVLGVVLVGVGLRVRQWARAADEAATAAAGRARLRSYALSTVTASPDVAP